jgi:hypothetical protein
MLRVAGRVSEGKFDTGGEAVSFFRKNGFWLGEGGIALALVVFYGWLVRGVHGEVGRLLEELDTVGKGMAHFSSRLPEEIPTEAKIGRYRQELEAYRQVVQEAGQFLQSLDTRLYDFEGFFPGVEKEDGSGETDGFKFAQHYTDMVENNFPKDLAGQTFKLGVPEGGPPTGEVDIRKVFSLKKYERGTSLSSSECRKPQKEFWIQKELAEVLGQSGILRLREVVFETGDPEIDRPRDAQIKGLPRPLPAESNYAKYVETRPFQVTLDVNFRDLPLLLANLLGSRRNFNIWELEVGDFDVDKLERREAADSPVQVSLVMEDWDFKPFQLPE